MKRITLSILSLLLVSSVFGQYISSRFSARDRGWTTFGIDGGWAYQSSDVRATFNGWGAGMTLGKNVFYRPGGALSFDIRGRALFTRSYGTDWRTNTAIKDNNALNGTAKPGIDYILDQSSPLDSSFVFSNFRTGMGELDAEGVITFNRLRERTGIVFSLFGGIGLNAYRARIDQGDFNGNAYDYLSIDRSNGKQSILAQLDNLRDGDYESRADGSLNSGLRLGVMPDAGVELGYQFGRNFVFGVGHKVTFSRTDVLDGERFSQNGIAENDWAHYTNLFMRWDIGSRAKKMKKPEVDITSPNDNPYVSNSSTVFIKADIKHVNSAADVHFYVNGESRAFEYRNGRFGGTARLRPGRNEVTVSASNPAGSDEETVVIVWEDRNDPYIPPPPPPPSNPAPVVRITNPSSSPYTTDRAELYLRAEVQYIRDKRDLRLLVNGAEERFTLAEGLEASLRLREGRNVVRIEASTPAGRASDEVVVEVRNTPTPPPTPPPAPPTGRRPSVNITVPATASASTDQKTYEIRADVTNVPGKSSITVWVNGTSISQFDYNTRSSVVTAVVDLQPNDNEIIVKAVNSAGEAQDEVNITRKGGVTPPVRKPTVQITKPTNNANFTERTAAFSATTSFVNSKNEVVVVFNGSTVSNFDFDAKNQTVSGTLSLKPGDNTLTIKVSNSAGSNESTVRFKQETSTPALRPEVSISSPANGSETRSMTAALTASVKQVTSKSEVSVYLNGRAISDFDFNNRTGSLSANLTLKEGDNTIRVTATNSAGTDEASHQVRYLAKKTPTVAIQSPADRTRTETATAELKANTTQVFSNKQVEVRLNGTVMPNFTLDRSGTVTASLPLKDGNNTISVSVNTPDGQDKAEVTVVYAPPKVAQPKVTFIQPNSPNATATKASFTVRAKVTDAEGIAFIKVFHNKTAIRKFDYNAKTKEVSYTVTLVNGKNTFRIEAQNKGAVGQGEASVTYNATPVGEVPEVDITNISVPSEDPMNPNANRKSTVKATLKHVDNTSQITATVNGTTISALEYNAATGLLNFKCDLKKGNNTIVVKVKTPAGEDTDTEEYSL